MAGRPRKHFEKPVHLGFQVPPTFKAAFIAAAEEHGMTYVDYLTAIFLQERGQLDLAPPIQEVLPKTG